MGRDSKVSRVGRKTRKLAMMGHKLPRKGRRSYSRKSP